MRIYIAGPMTGLPESNYPAFNQAAAAWRSFGWDVCNPAEHFNADQGRRYTEYVEADLAVLKTCSAIAMLPGWDAGHSGAIWEFFVARDLLGLDIWDATQPRAFDRFLFACLGSPQAITEILDAKPGQPIRSMSDHFYEWVDAVVPIPPITRNAQGELGRWNDGENSYGER